MFEISDCILIISSTFSSDNLYNLEELGISVGWKTDVLPNTEVSQKF